MVALLFFSALAISYRLGHPAGSMGMALDGTARCCSYSLTGDSRASQRSVGHPAAQFQLDDAAGDHRDPAAGRLRSITSLGEEAKDPKKDIPRGVLLSITIQCLFMYLIEYFAANYFMNSAYSLDRRQGLPRPSAT